MAYHLVGYLIFIVSYVEQALLHFIYRDTILEDEELFMLHLSFFFSLSESFIAKLLAVGKKYGMPRLMLMCESKIMSMTLLERATCMLLKLGLSSSFCADAVSTTCYLMNCSLSITNTLRPLLRYGLTKHLNTQC